MSNAQKQRLNALQASAGAVILETTLSIITDFYAKSKDIGIDNDVLQEFRSAVKDCIENRRPSAGMIEEAPIQLSDEQMESDSADEDDSVAESSRAKHNKTKPLPRRPLHRYPGNMMPCESYWDTYLYMSHSFICFMSVFEFGKMSMAVTVSRSRMIRRIRRRRCQMMRRIFSQLLRKF